MAPQTIVGEAGCRDLPSTDVSLDKENTLTEGTEDTTLVPEEEEEDEDLHGQTYHSLPQSGYTTLGQSYQSMDDPDIERSPKRLKVDHPVLRSPPFYFNLHRHSPKGMVKLYLPVWGENSFARVSFFLIELYYINQKDKKLYERTKTFSTVNKMVHGYHILYHPKYR